MKKIYAIDAFNFGFMAFFKNVKFLLKAYIFEAFFIFFVFFIGLLTAIIFSIPLMMSFSNIGQYIVSFFKSEIFSTANNLVEQLKIVGKFFLGIADKCIFLSTLSFLGIFLCLSFVLIILIMFSLGGIRISLDICDKGSSKISALFFRPYIIFKAFVIHFITLLAMAIPLVFTFYAYYINNILWLISLFLSFIFTFYLLFKTAYSLWFLVDKDTGIIESIKLSFFLKGSFINLFMIYVLFTSLSFSLGYFIFNFFFNFIFTYIFGHEINVSNIIIRIIAFLFSFIFYLSKGHLYRKLIKSTE